MLALTYQLFAGLCGWLEAILYAQRAAETFNSNEHVGMTFQRVAAALLVPTTLVCLMVFGLWWPLLVELATAALLFPLFHDEVYNFTRLWINLRVGAVTDKEAWQAAWKTYTYGYQSATTTARHDFSGNVRTMLAVAGAVLLLALYGWHFFIH